ncbi:hypothetical protein [Streptomyces sp. B6B3]|uniref:hypothetical protein n=1 Tax=Streptomyces sp. B6B3 TaxID=3153570 RepID=UPI00325F7EFD
MRKIRLVVPVALLVVSLTACGGDGGEDSAAGTGAEGGGDSQISVEDTLPWYDCMRENGVDVPDPDPDMPGIRLPEGGEDDPEVQAAVEACQEHMPGGGPGAQEVDAEGLESLRAFTACMRENGVDMADPDSTGALSMPEGVDPNGPEFQDAIGECQELLAGTPVMFGGGGR